MTPSRLSSAVYSRPGKSQAGARHGRGKLRLGVHNAKEVSFQNPLTAERHRRCQEHLSVYKSVYDEQVEGTQQDTGCGRAIL